MIYTSDGVRSGDRIHRSQNRKHNWKRLKLNVCIDLHFLIAEKIASLTFDCDSDSEPDSFFEFASNSDFVSDRDSWEGYSESLGNPAMGAAKGFAPRMVSLGRFTWKVSCSWFNSFQSHRSTPLLLSFLVAEL